LRCLQASSIHLIALSIPGINAEAFRAGMVNRKTVLGRSTAASGRFSADERASRPGKSAGRRNERNTELATGNYRPLRDRLMASRASLSAVRRRSVSRLSQSCLPLARAISIFTLPFLKYMRVGMRV
jgi:hypothetical protein